MNTLEPEYTDVYNNWKQRQTPETNQALIKAVQPYVSHAIMAAGGDPNNRVLQAKANMIALQYLHRYDPKKSTIQNFLYSNMRGLSRVVGNDNNIIQIPEYSVLGRKAISEAERDLTDKLGRFPTTEEVANKTGISTKVINKWKAADVPITESTLEGLESMSDTYPSSGMIGDNSADNAWQEYVYDSLSDRRKLVMERMYGLHGHKPQSQTQVAKALKISPAAVNQHKSAIDSMLNDDSRYKLFED